MNATSQAVRRSSPGMASRKSFPHTKKWAEQPNGAKMLHPPRKPLSAYNFFFQDERANLLGADTIELEHSDPKERKKRKHRKTHGKIGFTDLAKHVGKKWRELGKESKAVYKNKFNEDKRRYARELEEYEEKLSEMIHLAQVEKALHTLRSQEEAETGAVKVPSSPERQRATTSEDDEIHAMERQIQEEEKKLERLRERATKTEERKRRDSQCLVGSSDSFDQILTSALQVDPYCEVTPDRSPFSSAPGPGTFGSGMVPPSLLWNIHANNEQQDIALWTHHMTMRRVQHSAIMSGVPPPDFSDQREILPTPICSDGMINIVIPPRENKATIRPCDWSVQSDESPTPIPYLPRIGESVSFDAHPEPVSDDDFELLLQRMQGIDEMDECCIEVKEVNPTDLPMAVEDGEHRSTPTTTRILDYFDFKAAEPDSIEKCGDFSSYPLFGETEDSEEHLQFLKEFVYDD